MTLTKHEGILRTFRPDKRYGFIHERVASNAIAAYYFNADDVIEGQPIVGLRCEFYASSSPEAGRNYPHAVSITFEEFPKADPIAESGQNTLGGEVSR
jgi:hypothetical protein